MKVWLGNLGLEKSAYFALIAFEPFNVCLDLIDYKIGCVACRAGTIQH